METFAGTFIFTEIKTDVDIIYEFLKKFYIDYFVNNPHNSLYSLSKLDYTSIDTYRDLLLIILYNLFEWNYRPDKTSWSLQFIAYSGLVINLLIDEFIDKMDIPQIYFTITISIDIAMTSIDMSIVDIDSTNVVYFIIYFFLCSCSCYLFYIITKKLIKGEALLYKVVELPDKELPDKEEEERR